MPISLSLKTFVIILFTGFLNAQEISSTYSNKLYKLKTHLNNAISKNDTLKIAQTHIKLGDFFNELGLYNEATNHYQEFLELHDTADSSLVDIQNQLANINLELKQYSLAKQHALLALKISESITYKNGKANSNAQLGCVAEKQNNYDEAIHLQNISLSIYKTLSDSTGIAKTNENIGSIYEDLGNYSKALQYFSIAKLYAKKSNSNLQINIINNLGDINRKTKQFPQAISYTKHALELAESTNNQSQRVSALKDLSRVYADMGDFKKAYRYLNHQNIEHEKELAQNNNEIVSALQILYDVEEKEAKVKLLSKENHINKVQRLFILVITGTLILSLFTAFFYWKKRKKHEKHILEYKQQLLQVDLDKKTAEELALKREIDIKISSLTNYSLHIAYKNKMLYDISKTLIKLKGRNSELVSKKIKDIVKEIEADLNNSNEWTELMSYFGQIHPSFFSKLKQSASDKLSPSEMRLSLLLRLNLSSKEIADILHITADSVRIARYRLRKKLPIKSKDDLQGYLINL